MFTLSSRSLRFRHFCSLQFKIFDTVWQAVKSKSRKKRLICVRSKLYKKRRIICIKLKSRKRIFVEAGPSARYSR